MSKQISRSRRYCFLISLLLVTCGLAFAQHTGDGLGGTFNTPAGGTITKTIIDRIGQRRTPKRPSSTARTSSPGSTAPKTNEASVLFRPTGTHLKTQEVADLI